MASQGSPSLGEGTASGTKSSKGIKTGKVGQGKIASMIHEAVERIFSSHLPAIIGACNSPTYPSTTTKDRKQNRVLQPDPTSDLEL